jgi:L,D-peptidoglycan transpeptidase YkuD (ErfK/YbiS/YcfS/YnhG family)
MKKAPAIALLGLLIGSSIPLMAESNAAFRLPKDCSQLIVVTSASWSAASGTLQAFEKNPKDRWRAFFRTANVRLGRNGMAWGRGLASTSGLPGPRKHEGDDKAPAGIFHLGFAFGYSAQSPSTRMRYVPITTTTVCVDDPQSRDYNQMLDTSTIENPDWHSAERMKLRDARYKWGVFVMHNTPPKPGAGSCMFLHVWKDGATPTSGCTAMPEPIMLSLIKWLDPDRKPVLAQMPVSFLQKFAAANGVLLQSE